MRKIQFLDGEVYHIFNRGVDKRNVFLDNKDYFRMVHNLFEFNDEAPAAPSYYHPSQSLVQSYEVQPRRIWEREKRKPRKLLVEILCWCLMPNHFHLLLRQIKENGIVGFMQKLGTGYSMFFNQKYERSGTLFQGRFKAVHVVDEYHFMHLPFYIHANALDLIEPNWREGKIKNLQKVNDHLDSFRWSSHLDCEGKKNFSSISQRDLILDVYGGEGNYRKLFGDWLKEMDLERLDEVILEK